MNSVVLIVWFVVYQIVSVLVNIACLICVPHQWGHHVSAITISHHEFILTRVISWIIQPGFTFGIGVTKLSILLFYTRFASTRRFRIAIYVMITILTLWTIAFICVSFMLCKPLWAYWVYTYKEKAVNGLCSDAEGILYLVCEMREVVMSLVQSLTAEYRYTEYLISFSIVLFLLYRYQRFGDSVYLESRSLCWLVWWLLVVCTSQFRPICYI